MSLSLSHFSLTYKYLLKKKMNSQLVQTNNLDLYSIIWKKECEYLILPGNFKALLISWGRHSKGEPNLCSLTYISFETSQSVASFEHVLSQYFFKYLAFISFGLYSSSCDSLSLLVSNMKWQSYILTHSQNE